MVFLSTTLANIFGVFCVNSLDKIQPVVPPKETLDQPEKCMVKSSNLVSFDRVLIILLSFLSDLSDLKILASVST